jgi:hypothetical protein
MIIYNVTCHISDNCHTSWLHWMQKKHIPEVLQTGKFSKAVLVKVLVEEEQGGVTYSVQYHAADEQSLVQYYKEDAPRLRQEGLQLFGDEVLYFRTELQVIDTFELY